MRSAEFGMRSAERRICLKVLRPFEDIVRADSSENVNSSLDLEGETIVFGNPSFPDVRKALHLFKSQRRVLRVGEKKL